MPSFNLSGKSNASSESLLIEVVPGVYKCESLPISEFSVRQAEKMDMIETDLSILQRAGISPQQVPAPSFVSRPDTVIDKGLDLVDSLSRLSQPVPQTEDQAPTQSES